MILEPVEEKVRTVVEVMKAYQVRIMFSSLFAVHLVPFLHADTTCCLLVAVAVAVQVGGCGYRCCSSHMEVRKNVDSTARRKTKSV